jgi:hypothetical protein
MTRLIQIQKENVRRVALVEEPSVRFLRDCSSIYELAQIAMESGKKLGDSARERLQNHLVEYDPFYNGRSEWRLLPPIDHPGARSLSAFWQRSHSHRSARDRQSMHANASEQVTDSMKIFRWGVEGGRPEAGGVGISPAWFHKGTGSALRAHGEPLDVPSYAEDGGEEAENAGVYEISRDGRPYRVGMAVGNEFSDHQFEKKNYLYLEGSKLRSCALGPELVVDYEFESVPVSATVLRDGNPLWSKTFRTGELATCRSLQNIEHHHFKFEAHRRPGDVHVLFFGTDRLSFGDQIRLQDGDIMQIAADGYGRPLRNPVRAEKSKDALISVIPLRWVKPCQNHLLR